MVLILYDQGNQQLHVVPLVGEEYRTQILEAAMSTLLIYV